MDIEKFTDRARGFLQAAQTIAIRDFHQQVTPGHLLKALLDDPEGAASGLIRAAGGDPMRAKVAVDSALGRIPKVTGGGASAPERPARDERVPSRPRIAAGVNTIASARDSTP